MTTPRLRAHLLLGFLSLVLGALLVAPPAARAQEWAGDTALTFELEDDRGQPVEGATVRLGFVEIEPMEGPPPTLTNSAGEAQVLRLAEGRWRLDVQKEGFSNLLVIVRLEAGKKPTITAGPIRDAVAPPMKIDFKKSPKRGQQPPAIAPPPMIATRAPLPEPKRAPDALPDRARPPAPPAEPEAPAALKAPAAEAQPEPSQTPIPETVPEPTLPRADQPERPEPAPASPSARPAEPPAATSESPADERPTASAPDEPPVPVVADPPAAPSQTPVPETVPQPPSPPSSAPAEPALIPQPSPPPSAPEAPPAPAQPVPSQTPIPESVPEPALPRADEPAAPEPAIDEPAAPEPAADRAPATVPTPAAPPAAAVPEVPSGRAELRSFTEASCPGCKTGEWALTFERSAAPASGRGCPSDLSGLERALRDAAEQAGAVAEPAPLAFAGGAPSELAAFLDPSSSCQLLAVAVPSEIKYTGYRFAARDANDGGDCQAAEECGIGEARWSGHPNLVRTADATVVWALFDNRSRTLPRQPILIVYLNPPRGWRPGE